MLSDLLIFSLTLKVAVLETSLRRLGSERERERDYNRRLGVSEHIRETNQRILSGFMQLQA